MKSRGRKPSKTQRRRAPSGPWTPARKVGKDVPRTASGKPLRPAAKAVVPEPTGERPRKTVAPAKVLVGERPSKKTIRRAAPTPGPRASPAEAAERAEQKLDGFIAKFDEANQTLIRRARAALRNRLPAANELVYDNYNFFVIGYSPSERTSDAILSIAANAKGLGLSFIRGASLADPAKLLQGEGNQTRFIRLPTVEVLKEPAVEALIAAAIAASKVPLATSGRGVLIIRSVSAKQRPRRNAD